MVHSMVQNSKDLRSSLITSPFLLKVRTPRLFHTLNRIFGQGCIRYAAEHAAKLNRFEVRHRNVTASGSSQRCERFGIV
jgi:hypothetical protein